MFKIFRRALLITALGFMSLNGARADSPVIWSGACSSHAFNLGNQTCLVTGGGGSATWGLIVGTLSDQTDLASALNAKQNALTLGNLTHSGSANLTITGGTGAVIGSGATLTLTGASIVEATSSVLTLTGATNAVLGTGVSIQVKQSSTSQSGYLSNTDWNTFNGKQATVSFGAFGSTPNANGGDISGGVVTLEPADVSNPGGVSTTFQVFAGQKTFNDTAFFSGGAQDLSSAWVLSPNGSASFANGDATIDTAGNAGFNQLQVSATSQFNDVMTVNANIIVNQINDSSNVDSVEVANRSLKDIPGSNVQLQWDDGSGNVVISPSQNITLSPQGGVIQVNALTSFNGSIVVSSNDVEDSGQTRAWTPDSRAFQDLGGNDVLQLDDGSDDITVENQVQDFNFTNSGRTNFQSGNHIDNNGDTTLGAGNLAATGDGTSFNIGNVASGMGIKYAAGIGAIYMQCTMGDCILGDAEEFANGTRIDISDGVGAITFTASGSFTFNGNSTFHGDISSDNNLIANNIIMTNLTPSLLVATDGSNNLVSSVDPAKIPVTVYKVRQFNQHANITSTSIVNPGASSLYSYTYYLSNSSVIATGTVTCTFSYTDESGQARTKSTAAVVLTSTTATGVDSGALVANVNAGGSFTYSCTLTGVTTGTPTYNFYVGVVQQYP